MPVLLEEIREGIATVTIDRPERRNALDRAVVDGLREAFDRLPGRDDVGVLLLTGSGPKAFVAGADLKEMSALSPGEAGALSRKGQELMNRIASCRKPVIAAINGAALGGGCELAMACHLRIAAEHAVLGQPEIKLGLIPGYGGTRRLPGLVGKGRALEMMLTGDPVTARDALRFGLVNRVVPGEELIASCREIAGKILAMGPHAVAAVLESVESAPDGMDAGLRRERELFQACFEREGPEGIAAFLEKRPPRFRTP